MVNIHDSDILVTQGNNGIYIDLKCGYGQPCVTTVTQKRVDRTTIELMKFKGNTEYSLLLGQLADLKYSSLEIFTTIQDVQDSDNELTDISLSIKVFENNNNIASTEFTRKTKGKGEIFNSFYNVVII
jgi:hypothetical protein